MGKKSVVFVAELSYMEKLEVALKSLCAHQGQWKIYVLNENLPTEWFTLMNRRLEAIDSEIVVCLQKALNNFRFRVRIFIMRLFSVMRFLSLFKKIVFSIWIVI